MIGVPPLSGFISKWWLVSACSSPAPRTRWRCCCSARCSPPATCCRWSTALYFGRPEPAGDAEPASGRRPPRTTTAAPRAARHRRRGALTVVLGSPPAPRLPRDLAQAALATLFGGLAAEGLQLRVRCCWLGRCSAERTFGHPRERLRLVVRCAGACPGDGARDARRRAGAADAAVTATASSSRGPRAARRAALPPRRLRRAAAPLLASFCGLLDAACQRLLGTTTRPGGRSATTSPPRGAAAILTVLTAADLVTLYVGFEWLGLIAYLFVIHTGSSAAEAAGKKYLVLTLLGRLRGARRGAAGACARRRRPGQRRRRSGRGGHHAMAAALCLLLGFGVKAGAIGLHSWLPDAHSSAPAQRERAAVGHDDQGRRVRHRPHDRRPLPRRDRATLIAAAATAQALGLVRAVVGGRHHAGGRGPRAVRNGTRSGCSPTAA
jgi:hypothetical protein